MKLQKILLWLFSFFLTFQSLSAGLVDNGMPTHALLETLDYFGIHLHTSWSEIVEQTQKQWLRPSNLELWQMQPKIDPRPDCGYTLFSKLGITQARYPTHTCYDYALILGATRFAMQSRLDFLVEAWKNGVRFKELVWLVGDRAIDSAYENVACKNETDLARLIYNSTSLPEEMRQVAVVFVDTPRGENQKRPTTVDTIKYWVATHPQPGSTLFIAQAPWMVRQSIIAQELLPKEFSVEMVGTGFTLEDYTSERRSTAAILDELARLIYMIAPADAR